ncbi:acyl-CoA N-acyltransferase [Gloeopeniophorella convolvens]|nr:acyl-CoA N-acyltransferase [Gloeopeniophorella convolvens]
MPLTIRPAVPADAPALSRICLLTGDAGQSAESLHKHGQLLGLFWALPYVLLPSERAHTWAYVLADDTAPDDHSTDAVKGYILGTSNTRAYEAAADAEWWPPLRARFPSESSGDADDERTEADKRYIGWLHQGVSPALDTCLAVSPAHMHIDLLPEVQRRGWGRKLIGCAVDHLRAQGIGALWLGMDGRNADARIFYEKLGFKGIPGAPDTHVALYFEAWKGVELA